MPDDRIRSHLRAALEIAIAEAERHLQERFRDSDERSHLQRVKLQPIVLALTAIKEEMAEISSIRISTDSDYPTLTIREDWHQYSFSFDAENGKYVANEVFCLPDPDGEYSGDRVHSFDSADQLTMFIVSTVAEEVASSRRWGF